MTDFRRLSDEDKAALSKCGKLSGCEHVRCLGITIAACDQREWDVSQPSRGLGDTIAKFTHATGIAAAVDFVSTAVGVPCGCGGRQTALNTAVPFAGQQ